MVMNRNRITATAFAAFIGLATGITHAQANEPSVDISQDPLFLIGPNAPPLTMLVMGRDHTLYYEAYNDASDLNGDGVLNTNYEPDLVDYYGYFDSFLCYSFNSTAKEFRAVGETSNKKCTGSGQWSGDFLNYLTTSRMDALRRVLYGGKRIVDTVDRTVLERAYIPQDAHSWGKEYQSIERDGYDIRDYSPLSLPAAGTRHLFANTTLLKDDVLAPNRQMDMAPLLRVLTDSRFRIWEWVAIERHVAGSRCIDGGNNNNPCVYAATTNRHNHPNSHGEFVQLYERYSSIEGQFCGSAPIAGGRINTSGNSNNPFVPGANNRCGQDYYLTLIEGMFYAPAAGEYHFATNGDDAVELAIGPHFADTELPIDPSEIVFPIDYEPIAWWYGGHGAQTGAAADIAAHIDAQALGHVGVVELEQGWHTFRFHHEERTGGDSYQLLWNPRGQGWSVMPALSFRGPAGQATTDPQITTWTTEIPLPASVMSDYEVRVQVCAAPYREDFCQRYTRFDANGDPLYSWKPTGLLHEYGEDDSMLFGLMSGSFTHPYNMRGGVLRKNVESFRDEVNPLTGQFTDEKGIVSTIDSFRIVDFDMDSNFQYRGGWMTDRPMSESNTQFPDWGNPIAEMMYETLRYFMGKEEPTDEFMPNLNSGNERVTLHHHAGVGTMDLPVAEWQDPFTREDTPAEYCSPAAMLVISDANPNYDTEFLPGSSFSSFSGDVQGLNVSALANEIWGDVYGGTNLHFIGETADDADSAPTPKAVSSFNIRGLSPAEPTKQGGYYSAAVSRFAFDNDLRSDLDSTQNVHTFGVALASPLPRIEIPVGEAVVSVVPFALSTGQGGTDWTARASGFLPTNTIVDFFVEEFANTDPEGSDFDMSINDGRAFIRFRINYEDVEQGADHDMDAIVLYDLRVNAEGKLVVSLTSEYQAGGITHNMGYVISGTTADGVYLEVSDDSILGGPRENNWYNAPQATPPGVMPGGCALANPPAACDERLPLFATREFSAGSDGAATVLRDPLWYSALVGSNNDMPLPEGEDPSNYFLVTNASFLAAQLSRAFERILALAEATSIATESSRVREGSFLYRAEFDSEDWTGNVKALDPFTLEEIWDARNWLNANLTSRKVFTHNGQEGLSFSRNMNSTIVWNRIGDGISSTALERFEWDDSEGASVDRLRDLVGYLLGETANHDNPFRPRSSAIGDIINSRLRYSGPRNEGWARLPLDQGGGVGDQTSHTYGDYIDCAKRDPRIFDGQDSCQPGRHNVVFVGANNGMMHAFDAEQEGLGRELFAYVPRTVQPNLWQVADPDFDTNRRFYVDGQFEVADAFDGTRWRTILIGGLGAGGKGLFALDVTTPQSFDENDVLWEINNEDADFANLGHVYGRPRIVRLEDNDGGRWVAVFGNGYGSQEERGYLYVVDLFTGDRLQQLTVPATTVGSGANARRLPGGLSGPAVVTNLQGTAVNRLYAGDLSGSLWRFEVSNGAVEAPELLFRDPDNNSITVTPTVARNSRGEISVFFGTGQLFAVGDNVVSASNEPVQTYYGLVDSGSALTRSDLAERKIVIENGERTITGDSSESDGWFMNMVVGNDQLGERIIQPASLSFGRLLFRSYEPNEDPCLGGGIIRDYPLDAISGTLASGLKIIERSGAPSGGSEFVIWDPPIAPPPSTGPQPPPPLFGGDVDSNLGPPDEDEDMTGTRDAWCPAFGFIDLDGNFTQMGTICDGRQSWRQVR